MFGCRVTYKGTFADFEGENDLSLRIVVLRQMRKRFPTLFNPSEWKETRDGWEMRAKIPDYEGTSTLLFTIYRHGTPTHERIQLAKAGQKAASRTYDPPPDARRPVAAGQPSPWRPRRRS